MSVKRKIFQLFEQMAEEKGAGRLRLAALFLAVILPLFLSTVSEAACWEDRLDRWIEIFLLRPRELFTEFYLETQ
jgi:hypothetical protein